MKKLSSLKSNEAITKSTNKCEKVVLFKGFTFSSIAIQTSLDFYFSSKHFSICQRGSDYRSCREIKQLGCNLRESVQSKWKRSFVYGNSQIIKFSFGENSNNRMLFIDSNPHPGLPFAHKLFAAQQKWQILFIFDFSGNRRIIHFFFQLVSEPPKNWIAGINKWLINPITQTVCKL